jgi:hypothetical protein
MGGRSVDDQELAAAGILHLIFSLSPRINALGANQSYAFLCRLPQKDL